MHSHSLEYWKHHHEFTIDDGRNEKRTKIVVLLTVVTMAVEIATGYLYGSMALLADGWHMGTHAAALGIAVFAYDFARRNAHNPKFSFGTGKVGALGGFGSAILLGIVALTMTVESVQRLLAPELIRFSEAIFVAVIGLGVNLISAFILRSEPSHGHAYQDGYSHHGHHHDQNLRAAYLHVIADALTSVLAIIALLSGKYFGWIWMDAAIGIIGATLIIRWAYGLMKDSGALLLDSSVDHRIIQEIKKAIESKDDNRIADIHVWRVGSQHLAAILSIVTDFPKPPEHYKGLLSRFTQLEHTVIEVNPCLARSELDSQMNS